MPHRIPHWFALTVKPQHEKTVAEQLELKSLESYTPLYKAKHQWSDRTKVLELPLFPTYVFCRFAALQRAVVLQTPGVTSIVGFGGQPYPVSDQEIEGVKKMIASGKRLKLYPHLVVGQPVRIAAGSMTGLIGILVREKSAYRVVVNVELLNRGVAVEVEREFVETVPPAPKARTSASGRGSGPRQGSGTTTNRDPH